MWLKDLCQEKFHKTHYMSSRVLLVFRLREFQKLTLYKNPILNIVNIIVKWLDVVRIGKFLLKTNILYDGIHGCRYDV